MQDKEVDVSQINLDEVKHRDFPPGNFAQEENEYRIRITSKAYNEILKHIGEDEENELCGVLVGKVYQDKHGFYLEVTNVIRGEHSESKGSGVTFTHDTWNYVHEMMDSRFRDQEIVGWYHSHPGFGIFLSDMDEFIQKNFFGNPSQVAFVIDVKVKKEGFFVWKKGKPKLAKRFWIDKEERLHVKSENAQLAMNELNDKIEQMTIAIDNLAQYVREKRWQNNIGVWFSWGLTVILAIALLMSILSLNRNSSSPNRSDEVFLGTAQDAQTGTILRIYGVMQTKSPEQNDTEKNLSQPEVEGKEKEKGSN